MKKQESDTRQNLHKKDYNKIGILLNAIDQGIEFKAKNSTAMWDTCKYYQKIIPKICIPK